MPVYVGAVFSGMGRPKASRSGKRRNCRWNDTRPPRDASGFEKLSDEMNERRLPTNRKRNKGSAGTLKQRAARPRSREGSDTQKVARAVDRESNFYQQCHVSARFGRVCKTLIRRFDPDPRLQLFNAQTLKNYAGATRADLAKTFRARVDG